MQDTVKEHRGVEGGVEQTQEYILQKQRSIFYPEFLRSWAWAQRVYLLGDP